MIKEKQVWKWVKMPESQKARAPFVKGKIVSVKEKVFKVQLQDLSMVQTQQQNCLQYSGDIQFNDMCQMTILNEPQILNNIKQRFLKRQIFTQIGQTLLITNPYQTINQLFNPQILQKYKQQALAQQSSLSPHIYQLAGRAYSELIRTSKKQTIIVSGESGAGKTESTKFCLQLLTSLSLQHEGVGKNASIEDKILSCNPILEAFGNSKTVRNDNSSRFGKYVQVYFDSEKNIVGAMIRSYLLEKSRVVQLENDERNYHCFYALVAGKLGKTTLPQNFTYLKKSNCYHAKNINDAQNFTVICKAMSTVGFTETQIQRIWQLLRCILQIGNIEIDDFQHEKDESQPCLIKNKQSLQLICKILNKKSQELQKFLLYQKRKFLKQYLLTPYNKAACRSNMDSLSKQLYSKTFDFILSKINEKLKATQQKAQQTLQTINILDIFGFQNFEKNSFQQICINFTNEKLLNLYNRYIFQKEIQVIKEDGLTQLNLTGLIFPNNEEILQIISSKKVSIFSIINDLTPHQQYKDVDILMGIKKQLQNSKKLAYPQNIQNSFVIHHSQCQVVYKIQGFKTKNKDKTKEQIQQLTQSLFQSQQKPINGKSLMPPYGTNPTSKQSKTLLSKFTAQIQILMSQLQSSNVHFVRCLKPNNEKKPFYVDEKYLLNQVRYLGVFETIKIRKSIFPCRMAYEQFKITYEDLFSKKTTIDGLLKKFDPHQQQFTLGKKRIYLTHHLEKSLNDMKQKIRLIKIQCARRILYQYRAYKFRKVVLRNLKTLKKKITLLTKYSTKNYRQNFRIVFSKLLKNCVQARQKQLRRKQLKQKEEFEQKQKIKKDLIKRRYDLIAESLPKALKMYQHAFKCMSCEIFIKNLKELNFKSIVKQMSKQQQLQLIPKQQKPLQSKNQNSPQYESNKLTQQQKQFYKQLKVQSQYQIQKQNYVSTSSSYQSTKTIVQENEQPYKRSSESSPNNKFKKIQQKVFSFPQAFSKYNSAVRTQESILFRYNLNVGLYDHKTGKDKLMKLKQIKKKVSMADKQKQDLVDSIYVNFKSTDLDKDTYNRILAFSQDQFSQKFLRKRNKIMGKSKSFGQIFKAKRKPLQKSLTKLEPQLEEYALKVFRQILKIYQDGSQEFFLIVIEVFLSLVVETPQQIVNQTFLQLLKQMQTEKEQQAIKVYKIALAFLHFFRPDPQFLDAGLYIFLQKIECHLYGQKEQSYLRLVFHKTYNKSIKVTNTKYIPSKFQLFCMICKKLFPFNFYLAMGNCVQFNVESDQTFSDIKCQILQRFSINIKRINPKYFAFFQIVTFDDGQMEQIPISDNDLVWDVKSYWEIAISRYQEHKITPPRFYFMVKLKFPFELQEFDYEGIELIYSECYFDYFTGKIRIPETHFMELAVLMVKIKKINVDQVHKRLVYSIFPLWSIRKYGDQTLMNGLRQYLQQNPIQPHKQVQDQSQQFKRKFQALRIFQKFPLSMSIGIPPDSGLLFDSSLLYYLKPRRLYVVQKQNMQILEEYELKKMLYWEVDEEKLSFQCRQGTHKTKTHVFYTEYAELFSEYLREIGQLMSAEDNK